MPMGRPKGFNTYGSPSQDPMRMLAQMVTPEAILASIMGGQEPGGQGYLDQAQSMLDQFGQGGGGLQSAMQSINQGYQPGIAAGGRALQQNRMQEAQDIADLQSWYGQLGGEYRAAAGEARRGGKKAARQNKRESRTANSDFGGPGAALLAADAAGAARSERRMGNIEGSMNSALAGNTMSQADYQALLRERLHAGERQDIRAQLNALKSQKASAKASARSTSKNNEFSQMMQLAQFLASQGGGSQMEDIGSAMQLLMQGGQSGFPGFERYAPEPQVDPTQMMGLYQSMLQGQDPQNALSNMSSATQAFGLPSGGQSDAMQNLVFQMAYGMGPDQYNQMMAGLPDWAKDQISKKLKK